MAERFRRREWTGDEFRRMLNERYPRAGWKARNLTAGNGRVYDLMDWWDKRCLVELAWSDGYVAGYVGDERVYEDTAAGSAVLDLAFAAVEDELMRRQNEESPA
jgi:hypothetical protein